MERAKFSRINRDSPLEYLGALNTILQVVLKEVSIASKHE